MKKLMLNVDDLEVQSFATTDARAKRTGTVEAFDDDSGRTPSMTRNYSCPTFCPGPESCAYTCGQDTCQATCDTCGFTCDVDSCYDTCHTNICACNISDFGTCIC
jgi:hypothetical protein